MIFARGPSNMSGYMGDEKATREVLSLDGWLNTGDLGYWTGESLVITGRHKDLIILKGRNVWPQDLEILAEEELGLRLGGALAFATTQIQYIEYQQRESKDREKDSGIRVGRAQSFDEPLFFVHVLLLAFSKHKPKFLILSCYALHLNFNIEKTAVEERWRSETAWQKKFHGPGGCVL